MCSTTMEALGGGEIPASASASEIPLCSWAVMWKPVFSNFPIAFVPNFRRHTYNNVVADSPNSVWLLINSYNPPFFTNGSFDPGSTQFPNWNFQPPNRVENIYVDNSTFFDPVTGQNTTMLHCDSPRVKDGDVNCTATRITVVGDGEPWPPSAQSIMDAAGPITLSRRRGRRSTIPRR